MKRHLQRWGAAYVLLVMFLMSWMGQAFTMQHEIELEGWTVFWSATFENWQSEFLQLLVDAILILALKHVIFKKDAEDMEKIQQDLDEIKASLGSAT